MEDEVRKEDRYVNYLLKDLARKEWTIEQVKQHLLIVLDRGMKQKKSELLYEIERAIRVLSDEIIQGY